MSGPEPKQRSLRACLSRVENGVGAGSKPELTYIDVDKTARDVADDHVERHEHIKRNQQTHRTARPAQQQRLSPLIAAQPPDRVPRGAANNEASAARVDAL